jgi:hypothetical protein
MYYLFPIGLLKGKIRVIMCLMEGRDIMRRTKYIYHTIKLWSLLLAGIGILVILAACGSSGHSGSTPPSGSSPAAQQSSPTAATAGTPTATTPAGPLTITSPTPVPGGSSNSQQVVMQDRVLVINSVKQDSGSGGISTITLALTIKNTSSNDIQNKVNFYQLVGSEGDVFGLPPTTSSPFFGPIAAGNSKSGTLAFQIPTAAVSNLRLLYRSEVPQETVFVSLNI